MKSLLTTTAAALLMGTAAFAQTTGDPLQGLGNLGTRDQSHMVSDMIGAQMFASPDQLPEAGSRIDPQSAGWNDVGRITDLVIAVDGNVAGVVVGVGGFLGLGDREVAVALDRVRTYPGDQGMIFAIQATEDELASAPALDRGETETEEASAETENVGTAVEADGEWREALTSGESEGSGAQNAVPEDATAPEGIETMLADGQEQVETDSTEFMTRGDLDLGDGEVDSPLLGEDLSGPLLGEDLSGPLVDEEEFSLRAMPEGPVEGVAAPTAEDLTGTPVYGLNDAAIGHVDDLVLGADGAIHLVIVDVGGFLGIGEKPVAIPFADIEMVPVRGGAGESYRLFIPASEEQLEAMDAWAGE